MRPSRLLFFAPVCLAVTAPAHAAILTVGAGEAYTTLGAAVAAASAGDTIDVRAGTYTDQTATINVPLTIVGVGGMPLFTQTAGTELPGLKGFLTVNADLTVDNIGFSNAAISLDSGDNGAGIRYQAGSLTVKNSLFLNNQNGILATPNVAGTGSVVVLNSTFTGNGVAAGPRAGFEHALYATDLASLTVMGSTFQGTLVGHDIKSRAAETTISGNTLDDGVTGSASYAIDIANGGVATISGNVINQGPDTGNNVMVTYGEEGANWSDNGLTVFGNVFQNSNDGAIGIRNDLDLVTANVSCNAFDGLPTITRGPATVTGNVTGTTTLPACATVQNVPEPPSPALLAVAGGALILWRRRTGRKMPLAG